MRLSRPAESSASAQSGQSSLVELVETMARLRRECAWKAGQTHRSLARYLLEESYEVLEAIEGPAGGAARPGHLREELGDLLLQVYFHAAIAAEAGEFDVEDVARDLQAKLVRRNPHVFGADQGADPARRESDPVAINEAWEAVKAQEKQRTALLDGIPPELPALLRADKVLDRLERAGRPVTPPTGSEDLGDRLLVLVAEARAGGVDAEQALRDAVRRISAGADD